jgi:ATP-dependent 26S proteasome regulatory subunit
LVFSGGTQDELQRTNLELESFKEKIKENQEKIKLNKQLPYLVGNIIEVQIFTQDIRFWNGKDVWRGPKPIQHESGRRYIVCTNSMGHTGTTLL